MTDDLRSCKANLTAWKLIYFYPYQLLSLLEVRFLIGCLPLLCTSHTFSSKSESNQAQTGLQVLNDKPQPRRLFPRHGLENTR